MQSYFLDTHGVKEEACLINWVYRIPDSRWSMQSYIVDTHDVKKGTSYISGFSWICTSTLGHGLQVLEVGYSVWRSTQNYCISP